MKPGTALTGPGAPEAATRLAAFAGRAQFTGQVSADPCRAQRLMNRHDPAIYPGTYVTCIYNHAKALCARSIGPDLDACRPLECRNAAFTEANRDAVRGELDRINASLASTPALPPLQHTVTAPPRRHHRLPRRPAAGDGVSRRAELPAEQQVRDVLAQMHAEAAAGGPTLSVLALARRLNLSNTTF
jgi:hypothetical protein